MCPVMPGLWCWPVWMTWAAAPRRAMTGASLMASGRVPTTTAIFTGAGSPLPEQVAALAGGEPASGDEQAQVELVAAQVVGDEVVAGEGPVGVGHAGLGAGGVAGGRLVGGAFGQGDRVGQVEVDQAGELGIGEGDLIQVEVQGRQVRVLRVGLEVVGGEGDGGLADPDGVQVGVGDGQAELFVDLADPLGDGLAGVVVAADGDVGVVGPVEDVPVGGL